MTSLPMTPMVLERTVKIVNKQGLHVRPAQRIYDMASRFRSTIRIAKDGEVADAKSILSIITLAAPPGTQLVLRAEGEDAEPALAAIEELIRSGFGEEI